MITFLLFAAVCFLAFSNGGNDNFKGVASLFGSDTTSYRGAITWATLTTFAGSGCAIVLAHSLLRRFSGKGLVPDSLVADPWFLLAVALGAGGTVIIATITGFPISTTHALVGAMLGGGLMAVGSSINLGFLGKIFLLPLLLSPLLSLILGALLYVGFRSIRRGLGVTKEWCVCAGEAQTVVAIPQASSVMAMEVRPSLRISAGPRDRCSERYAGRIRGVGVQTLVEISHFVSAGVVSFARGLNDTPKIAALLVVIPSVHSGWFLLAVGGAMAIGGLSSARRVAETMSHKLTGMNQGQAFSANLATGLLVIGASLFSVPVSTTHVSVGSLLGIGLTTGQANPGVMRNVLLSWIVTLPVAAGIAAIVWLAMV